MNPDLVRLEIFQKNIRSISLKYFRMIPVFGNDFRVRVFAATFGYLEDPATGSGNSALGYYLLQHQL
jgi:predicted PhzF superfamily epimerase YddE/YHI9